MVESGLACVNLIIQGPGSERQEVRHYSGINICHIKYTIVSSRMVNLGTDTANG